MKWLLRVGREVWGEKAAERMGLQVRKELAHPACPYAVLNFTVLAHCVACCIMPHTVLAYCTKNGVLGALLYAVWFRTLTGGKFDN